MSAIWGIVAWDRAKPLPDRCKELFETTYQRTCKLDRYESILTEDAYFGCGIQYITKESSSEQLPVNDTEHAFLFTADCILDNRQEVIALLSAKQYDKKSLSEAPDGTLLYLAYLAFGNDCVHHFRGLFSFAVWNRSTRTLSLFSDHTASRSLYYILKDGLLAFSTRREPLMKLFPNLTRNTDYCKDFLLADPSVIYVVPGETPYREISLMLPATRLTFSEQGKESVSYWKPTFRKNSRFRSSARYSKQFLSLYRDCVKDALRSSGEIGIAMSSGLDSSGVGVLVAQELKKTGNILHSYTFVPHSSSEQYKTGRFVVDESVPVKEIAALYPNIRTTFLSNNGKHLFADMAFCSNLLELPYKTGTFPNHYEMCASGAAAGCKVFLNGGFGNNTVSFGHISNGLYHLFKKKRFITFFSQLNAYATHEHIGRRKFLRRTLHNFRTFEQQKEHRLANFVPANPFLLPSIRRQYAFDKRFKAEPRLLLSRGFLSEKTYPDYLWAQGLLMYLGAFETQFGLATGMVLRDPTKDIRMLEFCLSLPFHLFTYHGTPRWLTRHAFRSLLPESVLGSWSQHGALNADWIDRVCKDWDSIKPELLRLLDFTFPEHCVHKEHLRTFLDDFTDAPSQHADTFVHVCALEGLRCFFSDGTDCRL